MSSVAEELDASLPEQSLDFRAAPGFERYEKSLIATWAARMHRRGARTEITTDHLFLKEALHVTPLRESDPAWLVHKTPDGTVAVRRWPGIAEIVPSLAAALAIVSRAVECVPPGA